MGFLVNTIYRAMENGSDINTHIHELDGWVSLFNHVIQVMLAFTLLP